ncbi:uncharacterized protein LOC128243271 [Mya arenaria]|uniref:uncharacterized protein LOC128243271 n=1 Tax=Mya arenaria TaxID=6604 RepID=UPI0022E96CAF|nr:uncharacterized protein LOC128243271 [Mya arenaria]
MDSDRESERLFSLRLSRVMGDIGVNSWVIARRRRTHLQIETIRNVYKVLKDVNDTDYIFGSQSEATTTPGMDSDTDYLFSDNREHVALSWRDWQYGKPNLLVLKDEHTPPQVCYLQRLRSDCPLSVLHPKGPDDVLDEDGRVLLTNTMVQLQDFVQSLSESGEIFRHGPSMTHDKNHDTVHAYHCGQLPDECLFMFHRPRPGHWPRPDTLARARETGVFLVPQGYTESPTKKSRACQITKVTYNRK